MFHLLISRNVKAIPRQLPSFMYETPEASMNGPLEDREDARNSLLTRFQYALSLHEHREEFMKRWSLLKPSPHVDSFSYEGSPIIGVGKFGTVRLMKSLEPDNYYALKILKKEKIVQDKIGDKVVMERKLLATIRFPFLVSSIFSKKDNDCLYLGLPFFGGSDLFNYHRRRIRFSEAISRFYSAQVVLALEYLHNVKCLYRDLKLENILIDTTGYIKLTDFGLSKIVYGRTTTLCGTPEYLAPEMIRMKPYGSSVDWWSLGIMTYELAAGYTPFAKYNGNTLKMYSKICEGSYEMPPYFSSELREFISGLLNIHQATRLGALCSGCLDIKNHKFFRDLNWRSLFNKEILPPFRPRLSHPGDTSYFRAVSIPRSKIILEKSDTDLYTKYFQEF